MAISLGNVPQHRFNVGEDDAEAAVLEDIEVDEAGVKGEPKISHMPLWLHWG